MTFPSKNGRIKKKNIQKNKNYETKYTGSTSVKQKRLGEDKIEVFIK